MKRTPEKTVSISKNTFGSLGESWKGKDWGTPTPSGVKTFRKSAAADARAGQLCNSYGTSNMLGSEKGHYGKLNGKRKFEDFSSKEKTFSPSKLPKLNISKTNFSSHRLGGDPVERDKGAPSTNQSDFSAN